MCLLEPIESYDERDAGIRSDAAGAMSSPAALRRQMITWIEEAALSFSSASLNADVAAATVWSGSRKKRAQCILCGWRRGLGEVLRKLDQRYAIGSQVDIIAEVPLERRDELLEEDGLDLDRIENIIIRHHYGSILNRRDILPLLEEHQDQIFAPSSVLLLTDLEAPSFELADNAVTVAALALQDHIAACDLPKMHVVGELQGVNVPVPVPNTEMVQTGLMDAVFMGQVAVQKLTYDCMYELIGTEHSVSLALVKPARVLACPDGTFTFAAAQGCVFGQGAVLIGYSTTDRAMHINPIDKDAVLYIDDVESLVVCHRT